LYARFPIDSSKAYRLVCMLFACTGGGTLVPIFINSMPVLLSTDAYAIAIFCSFLLHEHVPIMRGVLQLSPIFKVFVTVLYEILRASVVVKFTQAAADVIAPSEFSIPVFGPIFCGALGGCGGAFFPLNKGFEPIKDGLAQPMVTALVGATFLHLFNNTWLSDGVVEAAKKSHVLVACFFIAANLYSSRITSPAASTKKKKA
jgi:hypothetical protein